MSPSPAAVLPMSQLAYTGKRDYIRGADLLVNFIVGAHMLDEPRWQDARVDLLRLVRPVACNGQWQVTPSGESSATLDVALGPIDRRRYHFVETGGTITRRAPDFPSQLISTDPAGAFSGRARLAAASCTGDLINGIVEGNKLLHAATLIARGKPTSAIRLVYMESLPLTLPPIAKPFDVTFTLITERERQGHHYTIVRADGAFDAKPVVLCYSTS